MEPRHCSEVFPQPLTVARFEGLTELLDCLACDLFCLFDFHFSVLLFRGVLAPFTHSRGSKDAKQEDRSGEIGASRSERAARLSDTGFWWREAC